MVKARRLTSFLSAAALTVTPIAWAGAAVPQAPEARVSAAMERPNALAGDSTPVFIGLILIILFGWVVISDNRGEPDNPTSP